MTHFSPAELVDAAEGRLQAPRAAHVHECERCRKEIDALAATLQSLAVDDVPEPSPLFWDHFSIRVRDAAAQAAPAAGVEAWLDPRRWLQAAVTSALLLAAVSGVWLAYSARPSAPPSIGVIPAVGISEAATLSAVAPGVEPADETAAWTILTAAAADLKPEEATAVGFAVPHGTVDSAVLRLSPAERNELGRLLQNELKRSGD
jgi:hypothetical protein